MTYYAGIDVSLECSSVCVVDATAKIVGEATVASEPEALIAWFGTLGLALERIGQVPTPGRWIGSGRHPGQWHCDHASVDWPTHPLGPHEVAAAPTPDRSKAPATDNAKRD